MCRLYSIPDNSNSQQLEPFSISSEGSSYLDSTVLEISGRLFQNFSNFLELFLKFRHFFESLTTIGTFSLPFVLHFSLHNKNMPIDFSFLITFSSLQVYLFRFLHTHTCIQILLFNVLFLLIFFQLKDNLFAVTLTSDKNIIGKGKHMIAYLR